MLEFQLLWRRSEGGFQARCEWGCDRGALLEEQRVGDLELRCVGVAAAGILLLGGDRGLQAADGAEVRGRGQVQRRRDLLGRLPRRSCPAHRERARDALGREHQVAAAELAHEVEAERCRRVDRGEPGGNTCTPVRRAGRQWRPGREHNHRQGPEHTSCRPRANHHRNIPPPAPPRRSGPACIRPSTQLGARGGTVRACQNDVHARRGDVHRQERPGRDAQGRGDHGRGHPRAGEGRRGSRGGSGDGARTGSRGHPPGRRRGPHVRPGDDRRHPGSGQHPGHGQGPDRPLHGGTRARGPRGRLR